MPAAARKPDAAAVHDDIDHVLFTSEDISSRVSEIGSQLAEEYKDRSPILLAALNGAFMFLSDLCRSIQPLPQGLNVDFIRASSYHGTSTSTSGSVEVSSSQKVDIVGRHVLLVEDIVDTGNTALKLKQLLLEGGAASVKLVCLLNKPERRTCDIRPDYCCFQCPDEFVVGYGLDFDEHYRSLPYVGVLKPALYQ